MTTKYCINLLSDHTPIDRFYQSPCKDAQPTTLAPGFIMPLPLNPRQLGPFCPGPQRHPTLRTGTDDCDLDGSKTVLEKGPFALSVGTTTLPHVPCPRSRFVPILLPIFSSLYPFLPRCKSYRVCFYLCISLCTPGTRPPSLCYW